VEWRTACECSSAGEDTEGGSMAWLRTAGSGGLGLPGEPGGLGRGESSRGALGEVTKSGTDAEAGPSPRDAPRAGRGAGAGARGGERIDTLGEAGSVAPLSVIVNTPPEENGSDALEPASVVAIEPAARYDSGHWAVGSGSARGGGSSMWRDASDTALASAVVSFGSSGAVSGTCGSGVALDALNFARTCVRRTRSHGAGVQ